MLIFKLWRVTFKQRDRQTITKIIAFYGRLKSTNFLFLHALPQMSTSSTSYNPGNISCEEYLSRVIDLGERDIGRPLEQTSKIQKFKASLWLCEGYPLSLQVSGWTFSEWVGLWVGQWVGSCVSWWVMWEGGWSWQWMSELKSTWKVFLGFKIE